MHSTRVKICGLTHPDDVLFTVAAGADAIGFVFAAGSKRLVSLEQAANLARLVPPFVSRVGLFVNASPEFVEKARVTCGLDTLQFHGEETATYCSSFRRVARVLKALRVQDRTSLQLAMEGIEADAVLLDAYVPGQHGGTGARFDWDLAREVVEAGKCVILAGGLDAANVAEAVRQVQPYAVDVSSGVESSPGRKDPSLVNAFTRAVQAASGVNFPPRSTR